MRNRIQLLIRLDPELNQKFQEKLQSVGWTKNRLLIKLIESFVAGEQPPSETGEKLLEEMQQLNRKVMDLETLLRRQNSE